MVLFEPHQGIDRAAFPFRSIKVVVCLRVNPLVRILTGSTATTTTCWWCSQLTIWTLTVFLLHMCIQSWVAQVSFVTVLALEITSFDIIFAASLVVLTAIAISALTLIIILLMILRCLVVNV